MVKYLTDPFGQSIHLPGGPMFQLYEEYTSLSVALPDEDVMTLNVDLDSFISALYLGTYKLVSRDLTDKHLRMIEAVRDEHSNPLHKSTDLWMEIIQEYSDFMDKYWRIYHTFEKLIYLMVDGVHKNYAEIEQLAIDGFILQVTKYNINSFLPTILTYKELNDPKIQLTIPHKSDRLCVVSNDIDLSKMCRNSAAVRPRGRYVH